MNKKVERIKHLTTYLNNCRNSYYNNSESLISDKEYDELFDELLALENETDVIMSNSPTQTVGYEVKSKLEKTTHSHPMLSLDKTKSIEDLKKFAGDKECLLMHKLDGLTVLLTYNNGELIKAETRGNGEVGEDITHNAKVFENIPLKIEHKGHLEIEGEAIITYNDFEKINAELDENNKYKNPRNLVSGSVRQLDSSIAANRHIKFVVWKVPSITNTSMIDSITYMKELGFDIVPFEFINHKTNNYEELIESLKNKANTLGYPIDGLVIDYDDIQYGLSLGTTGHHPRHSLAFKFYENEEVTIVKDIEWSVGKTGQITPVAVFEPIALCGTTVERASVHNVSILTELDLHVGDEITVYKANEIIPQIRENLSKTAKGRYIVLPNECPICGGETKPVKEKDTIVLTCTNPNCKGKLLGKLTHFCSKNAMNIEGLSESTLEKFIEEGFVESFIDVYELKAGFYDDIVRLDGFGKRSTDKLMEAIENSRNTTLDRFIYSLSIPLIGRTASKDIAKFFNYDYEDFKKYGIVTHYKQIERFGDSMNDSLHNWLNRNHLEMEELASYFNFEKPQVVAITDDLKNLSGKTFVITGSLNIFKNREEAIKEIESVGGKVSGSVSAKTNYLVNNDVNSTSGKNKKAKELGIPIISEEQLVEMIR